MQGICSLTFIFTAWWIAFGPHGPRAETPPGEWGRVWFYTGVGVAVSAVLFFSVQTFARPPPRTMTKEWQEATNEYLKVSLGVVTWKSALLTALRKNKSILSMVSAAKATKARATCRASRQKLKVSAWSQMNRRIEYGSCPKSVLQDVVGGIHGWLHARVKTISIAASIAHVQKLNFISCAILFDTQDISMEYLVEHP